MIKIVPKRWGKEEWIINDEYCGKILTVKKKSSSSIHYHKNKKETFFVLSGRILLEWYPFNDFIKRKKLICSAILQRGQAFTLYPHTVHKFTSLIGESKILEISTHHDDSDSHRIRENKKL